jgi:hypothetical protein
MIQLARRTSKRWIQLDRDRCWAPRGKHKSKTLSLKVTEPFFCGNVVALVGQGQASSQRRGLAAKHGQKQAKQHQSIAPESWGLDCYGLAAMAPMPALQQEARQGVN